MVLKNDILRNILRKNIYIYIYIYIILYVPYGFSIFPIGSIWFFHVSHKLGVNTPRTLVPFHHFHVESARIEPQKTQNAVINTPMPQAQPTAWDTLITQPGEISLGWGP